jgi:hypothetical protein
MNELSFQGKIYIFCQIIYFFILTYGIYQVKKLSKKIEEKL